MLDHFAEAVVRPKKLKGKAKAMVATRNIEAAIRYFLAIRQALAQQGAPYEAIVAFTGKNEVDGVEYTEDSLNGFNGNDIAKKFRTDRYRILVVANKFLTGFDEPMLSTTYVDKKLQGVLAVQALSRLNRCNNKLGKEETFILDFHNTVDDIKNAFDDFYTSTALSEPTDVNVLHDLKDALDDTGIYDWHEVEEFNRLFFASEDAERLAPVLDNAAERFNGLQDEEKVDAKIKAKQFVKIYALVACIIPFSNADWEMLHWFLKFLIPKMKVKEKDQEQIDELLESVDLATYGLERVKLGYSIGLDSSEAEVEPPNPNPRGAHGGDPEKDPLDLIIAAFNEAYFTGWDATPEEQRVNLAKKVMEDPAFSDKVVNNADAQNRRIASDVLIEKAIRDERRRELELYRKYASDADFSQGLRAAVQRIIEHTLKEGETTGGDRAA